MLAKNISNSPGAWQHRIQRNGSGPFHWQKVVENHGGYVTAESIPGEGASFKIYLPVG